MGSGIMPGREWFAGHTDPTQGYVRADCPVVAIALVYDPLDTLWYIASNADTPLEWDAGYGHETPGDALEDFASAVHDYQENEAEARTLAASDVDMQPVLAEHLAGCVAGN